MAILNSDADRLIRPTRGWIRAIREALGMTTTQLAARLEISQPTLHAIEKSEMLRSIKLNTLERTARGLDCQLVYALVPRKPLQEMVLERVRATTERQLKATGHSMALEAQGVDDLPNHLERETKRRVEKATSEIWND